MEIREKSDPKALWTTASPLGEFLSISEGKPHRLPRKEAGRRAMSLPPVVDYVV